MPAAGPPERPALHGLIEQLPRRWPNDEVKASWLYAFGKVLDYTVPMSKPKPGGDDLEQTDDGGEVDNGGEG
jgi:hypothetical protein